MTDGSRQPVPGPSNLLNETGLAARSFAVELLARGSLKDAMIYADPRFVDRVLRLELRFGRKWMGSQVCDGGPGFNWRKARLRQCEVESESGRGLTHFSFMPSRFGSIVAGTRSRCG